ncbi:MAG: hypothetical protein IT238_01225 [Bacteroidia bacterium]|nr:hypothetical protein [Bacteroidia bacterium]MCZ2247597.1 hypothetical protein [Bacteroidia bacterium]
MKKPNSSKKAATGKKNLMSESEGKKPLKLKPIKSKEVKRTKNPSFFEEDDDLFDDDITNFNDFDDLDLSHEDDDDDF